MEVRNIEGSVRVGPWKKDNETGNKVRRCQMDDRGGNENELKEGRREDRANY